MLLLNEEALRFVLSRDHEAIGEFLDDVFRLERQNGLAGQDAQIRIVLIVEQQDELFVRSR